MFNFLSIKNNEIVFIPLAYNTFIYKLNNSKKMPVYEKDISLQDEFVIELKEYINKIYMQDKTVKIVLDFCKCQVKMYQRASENVQFRR